MNRDQVWKNFDLGTEVEIAGTFIYNGLRCFHEMLTLEHPEEIFEFTYNVAVGIERLLKVTLILLEHDPSQAQRAYEQSLITHNHLDLMARVRAKTPVQLATRDNDFLALLGTFYNSLRYDRLTRPPEWSPDKEKAALCQFFHKHLSVTFDKNSILPALNSRRLKRFVGKTVGKISSQLYDIAMERARSLNLFTYERRSESKATKIFLQKKFTFEDEDVLLKELLIFFMNTRERDGLLDYLRGIEPLGFDAALAQEYFSCFNSEEARLRVLGELETLYADLDRPRERIETLEPIGDPSVYFDDYAAEEDEQ
jgi:hypothetical protein